MRKKDKVLDINDIDMDAVAAAVDAAAAGEQPEPWKPTVGEKVLYWAEDEPIEYGGPADGGFDQIAFGYGKGKRVFADADRCAPADTPLADPKDTRLRVTKSRKPYSWAPGPWCLELPKRAATWHRTKRDATAAGRVRLAILDFHAARQSAAEGGSGS